MVRPLDTREATPADRGFSHIGRRLRFIGIDAPGALQASWTVPAFTLHALPPGLDLRLAALAEPLAVACHDVRRGEVAAGETAVVIGGGPIGTLIAIVARARGARVILVEPDVARRTLAAELGLSARGPAELDVLAETDGVGAEVVFEVSGSRAGILAATQHAAIRGRVVVVAIFPEPKPVALFDLFWKELELRGARVYEPEDFERRDRASRRRLPRPRPADHGRRAARARARCVRRAARRPDGDEDPRRLSLVTGRPFDLSDRIAVVTGAAVASAGPQPSRSPLQAPTSSA